MIKEIRNNNFNSVDNEKYAIVDFNASWCGPCRMLAPILEDISNEYKDVSFFSCDVDQNGELAMKYGIQSIPAVGLFKYGKLINMSIGFRPKEAIKAFIESEKWRKIIIAA